MSNALVIGQRSVDRDPDGPPEEQSRPRGADSMPSPHREGMPPARSLLGGGVRSDTIMSGARGANTSHVALEQSRQRRGSLPGRD
jgi:hypothetical protein